MISIRKYLFTHRAFKTYEPKLSTECYVTYAASVRQNNQTVLLEQNRIAD